MEKTILFKSTFYSPDQLVIYIMQAIEKYKEFETLTIELEDQPNSAAFDRVKCLLLDELCQSNLTNKVYIESIGHESCKQLIWN